MKTSGLRGLVTELTDELVHAHIRAFLAACPHGGTVHVGRDLRDSSPRIAATVIEAIRQWQPRCQATPVWGDLRDFVLTLRERAAWDAMLHLRDGTPLVCHVVPVSRGATVVRFSQALTSPARAPATAADKLADA